MYSHLVITAGISGITARNVLGKALRAEPGPLAYPPEAQNPALQNGATEEDALNHVRSIARRNEILQAMRDAPKFVSAEFSLLNALRQQGRLHDCPRVVLLHTASLGGRVAATGIAALLESAFGATCHPREIGDLDTRDPQSVQKGLGAFMQLVTEALQEVDPAIACFAPQGGYKIMASLA